MKILPNAPLAPYTSLRVGGSAEQLILLEGFHENAEALAKFGSKATVLGYGCNVLISDKGLAGSTLILRGGEVIFEGATVIADAGVWWDDVVKVTIEKKLWGLELMSEIPSSIGGAVFGNIAAYGQQVSDTLVWLETYNRTTGQLSRHSKDEFEFTYRSCSIQSRPELVIVRAAFRLSLSPTHELRYDSALGIASELNLRTDLQQDIRKIIIETRRRAGSLYHPETETTEHSAGSFFKNPMVSTEQAKELATHDETGKTLERIENQSKVHGGDTHRASAAHVLLAAGFTRGQTWNHVRLHPNHVLKIETLEGATAQNVYDVAHEIIDTVQARLNIALETEVRFLGEF